jgi:integrase
MSVLGSVALQHLPAELFRGPFRPENGSNSNATSGGACFSPSVTKPSSMAMQDQANEPRRVPWNKGKLTGAKPPLRPKHVWSIRTKLQIEGRARDLAMFNLAIDSKLRGCDVVAIRVEDVAAGGYTADRATVRQKKTGRPVRFELSEQTRQAVDRAERTCSARPQQPVRAKPRSGGLIRSPRRRAQARSGARRCRVPLQFSD